MEFEIDVSGEDLFSKDYTICVAQKNNESQKPIIFGYKFTEEILRILKSRHGQKKYRYGSSQSQKALFKIRLYCIVIYFIIKHIQKQSIFDSGIYLNLCRDFEGRENDIKSNLNYFLRDVLKLEIKKMHFCKLEKGSNADGYAFMMRKDKKDLMKDYYLTLKIEDFEIFLKE
ncbi:MAG: hypothetical protein NTW17_00005 [Candidatus Pacearchaeota archaeon]|nr:hypothetical protein [Candidatus Pacearchaeota archaeon]